MPLIKSSSSNNSLPNKSHELAMTVIVILVFMACLFLVGLLIDSSKGKAGIIKRKLEKNREVDTIENKLSDSKYNEAIENEVAPGFKQKPIKGNYRVIEHNTEKTCWNICDTKNLKETREGYILYPPIYCYIYINGNWDSENYFKPIETIYVKELTTIISKGSENKNAAKRSKKETYRKESCYQLGFRYGRCGAMVLKGYQCDPADDIVMPIECRGQPSDKGMRDGVASVY